VGEAIRKRALRRLFSAERYGVRDGLDDYDDDFRARMAPMSQEVAERMRQWWQDSRREPEEDNIVEAGDDSATLDGGQSMTEVTVTVDKTPPDPRAALPLQDLVLVPVSSANPSVTGAATRPPWSIPGPESPSR